MNPRTRPWGILTSREIGSRLGKKERERVVSTLRARAAAMAAGGGRNRPATREVSACAVGGDGVDSVGSTEPSRFGLG